ncbi:hypothetical protein GGI05_004061, partial [Coemansia sp. RSA 2603]
MNTYTQHSGGGGGNRDSLSNPPISNVRTYMSHPPGPESHVVGSTTNRHAVIGEDDGGKPRSRSHASSSEYRPQPIQTYTSQQQQHTWYNTVRSVPQTVTARMVDPSDVSNNFSSEASQDHESRDISLTVPSHGHMSANAPIMRSRPGSSVSSRYDPEHRHNSPQLQYHQYQQQQQQQQQIQPTIAALALADSRGQLDSGLGYYQPQRLRADIRANQGFHSEPASGAGSPM